MQYNKLVRDKVVDIIKAKGETAVFHVAEDAEYWEKLKAKLLEEYAEFQADESIGEVADVLEVLEAIAKYKGYSMEEVHAVKAKKLADRGGFDKRIILEEA